MLTLQRLLPGLPTAVPAPFAISRRLLTVGLFLRSSRSCTPLPVLAFSPLSNRWNRHLSFTQGLLTAGSAIDPTRFASSRRLASGLFASDEDIELTHLRVPELKDRLRSLGLKLGGRKAELIDRLQSHYRSEGGDYSSSPTTLLTATMPKTSPTKRKEAATDSSATSSASSAAKKKSPPAKKSKKKATKSEHQRQTERTPISKLWDGNAATAQNGSYTMRIMSWNVAGLRAVLKNHPDAIPNLAKKHGLDVICLQETKLQEVHVDDPKLKIGGHLLEEEGYDAHYSCSTTKKGYSGTAVFIKRRSAGDGGGSGTKKQASLSPCFKSSGGKEGEEKKDDESRHMNNIGNIDVKNLIPTVSFGIDNPEHDAEGRSITLDFPLFTMTNVYVPNSGQKLDRLSYRTKEWDKHLLEYMQKKEKERNCPVIWLGDLNVAHTAKETWNEGAKHLVKSAGTTPEERASFQEQLDAGYVDAFRHLHPGALGHYSYWSQRAGNREPNKGLRLDYFVCSEDMMQDGKNSKVVVRDSYMIPDQKGSDHCPCILELEIKS